MEFLIKVGHTFSGARRWRRWLRHCATSRKVAGSIYWNFSLT